MSNTSHATQSSGAAEAGVTDAASDDLDRHAADRWPLALKWSPAERASHRPGHVLRARSTMEVAEVVKQARQSGQPVIPFGAGSGVVGAVVGPGGGVTVDMSEMSRVLDVDDDAGLVTVQAGVNAGELERTLNERGRRLPHYPQSLHLATVGGLVATRSSGTFSSKYGNIEDLIVAVEAVLADGTIVRTKATPRASAGPNLLQLFVGSEGTLAILTEITLRTLPLAEHTTFRAASFPSIHGGLDAVRSIMDRGLRPAVIRLYDEMEAKNLYSAADHDGGGTSLLVLAFDGPEEVVAAEEGETLKEITQCGGSDLGPEIGELWEQGRFNAHWFVDGNRLATALADAIEVSATWPVLRGLRSTVLAALEPHVDHAYAHYSHFYTCGGSIYFIFSVEGSDVEEARSRYHAAWQAGIEAVLDAGGSISHHHGIGLMRQPWLADELGSSHEVLQRIKSALDPTGTLNPNKMALGNRKEASA